MGDDFDLGKACLEGNSNLILRYLDNLDNANIVINRPDKDKRTPLHWAASTGLIDVIRSLCDKGADTEVRDEGGWTPLMIASSAGRAGVVEELLYRGADPLAENPRGQTSLHYAASKGHVDVARVLLVNGKGGADVNARDKAKQCPIHRAASTGNDAMIRLLLNPPPAKNGAPREKTRVNPADRIGNTPLHLALDSGHGSTAVVLIEEGGADRDRVNQDGQRPMEMQGTNEIEQKRVLDYIQSRIA